MAEKADGSIYIDTKIDTKGFKVGEKAMADSGKRLVDSVSKVSQTAKNAMQSASGSYNSAVAALERQKKAVADLQSQLTSIKNQKIPTAEYSKLSEEFEKAREAAAKANEEYESMRSIGFSDEYLQPYITKLDAAESALDRLLKKELEMRKNGTAFQTNDTSAVEEKLAAANERLSAAQSKVGYRYSKLYQTAEKYAGQSAKLIASENKLVRVFGRFCIAVGKTASQFKAFASKIKNVLALLAKFAAKIKSANKSANNAAFGLVSMLKNALLIGTAMRAVYAAISGVGAGMNNLVQYSDRFNQSVSSMYSALQYLKNALATAFAPIVNVVAPYITAFINMMAKAATYVGMFFAALTGQNSFVAALPVAQDYAAAIGDAAENTSKTADATKKAAKENKKYLSGLDEIRRYTDDNDSRSSPTAGSVPAATVSGHGTDVSKMFKTVSVPSSISDLADRIKQAWAKADFTNIGTMLGEKLKAGLNSVPWSNIQATAAKVGTSFATLINGIVEVPNLGYTIGNMIAQAINTGLIALSNFATSLHWNSVGKFIADGINGVCKNIDWASYFSGMGAVGRGLATSLNNVITPEVFGNIGATLGKVVRGIVDSAYQFLTTANFQQYGTAIGTGINKAIQKIDWHKMGEDLGLLVENAIKLLSNLISAIDWGKVKQALEDFFGGVAEHVDMGKLGLRLAGLFSAWLVLSFVKSIAVSTMEQIGRGVARKLADNIAIKLGEGALLSTLASGANALLGLLSSAFTAAVGVIASVGTTIVTAITGAISAAVAAIGLAPLLAIAAGIVALIIGGIWVAKHWDEIKEFGSKLVEKIKEAIVGIANKLKEIGAYIPEGLKKGIELFLQSNPIAALFATIITAVKSLFGINSPSTVFAEIGGYIIQGLLNGLTGLLGSVVDIFTGLKDSALEKLGALKESAGEKFASVKESATTAFTKSKEKVVDACGVISNKSSEAFANVQDWAKEKFESAKTSITDALSSAKTTATTHLSTLGTKAKDAFSSVQTNAKTAFNNAKSSIANSMSGAKTTAGKYISSLHDGAVDKFEAVYSQAKKSFGNVQSKIGSAFSDGADTALSGIQRLADGLKDPINTIIGFLNGLIIAAVSAWNNIASVLSFDIEIPSVLRKLTGWSHVSLTVPKIRKYATLPYLASGAVIPPNKEFLAVLGDQKSGNNIETPEKLLRQIVREESGNGNSGGQYQFTAQINRRVLFDEFVAEAKLRQQQTGQNPLTSF